MKKNELICYDFDGTLCHTLPDIVNSMNVVLEQNGCKAISEARVRSFIGSGISKLVERSVRCALSQNSDREVTPALLEKVGREMSHYYSHHLMDHSYLYADTRDILEHYKSHSQIIVSNKPVDMVKTMVDYYGIAKYFDLIIGGDTLATCKPAPEVWEYIKKKLKLDDSIQGVMVGDSLPDIRFGKVAGLKTIAVTYGYNDLPVLKEEGADHYIDSLSVMMNII